MVREVFSWGDGEVGDDSFASFCGQACYEKGVSCTCGDRAHHRDDYMTRLYDENGNRRES